MSVLESSNLRDLLRVRDNEDDGREALAGLTLAAVLGCESNIRRPSRTLLDIIKDEESGAAYRGLIPPTDHHHHHNRNNNSWKSFKNRLRLRRAGEAFSSATSSNPVNACDFSIEDCNIRISTPVLMERRGVSINQRLNRNSSLVSPPNGASPVVTPRRGGDEEQRPAREEMGLHSMETALEVNLVENSVEQRPEREMGVSVSEDHAPAGEIVLNSGVNTVESDRNATAEEAEEVVAPPRVSLMALLEETDWSIGGNVGSTVMDIDEVEEELGGEGKKDGVVMGGGKEGGGGGEYVCCVCMVRHKGAAFIPCGHTFCRLCSRELWVNRGNCPLCNGFILEILDIF